MRLGSSTMAGLFLVLTAAAPVSGQVAPGQEATWVSSAVAAPGVEYRTFLSPAVGGSVSYHIYTPDDYASDGSQRFPVLYWLHGSDSAPGPASQLPQYLAAAMRDGRMPPMLVVIPNGLTRSFWVNSKSGHVPLETVIIDELIPDVDANFRTVASRQGRVIEGFSLGGYGAARFGFKYPELFGAVSILSGGPLQPEFTSAPRVSEPERLRALQYVFGGDTDYFTAQSPWTLAASLVEAQISPPRIRVVVGTDDVMLDVTRAFHEHLNSLGIDHEFIEVPGVGHDTRPLLDALAGDYWKFFRPGF